MAFIQVEQSLVSHRKTLRLARLLNMDRYAVVGRLVALWSWCLDNAPDGALTDDIDARILAEIMGWENKPAELLDALLLTAGFLELHPTDQRLHLYGWRELVVPPDGATDDATDDPMDGSVAAWGAVEAADARDATEKQARTPEEWVR